MRPLNIGASETDVSSALGSGRIDSIPALLLLPDTRPGVGFGHLSRCLVLAEEWIRRNGFAELVATGAGLDWVEQFRPRGVRVVDAASIDPATAAWTVLDGYQVGGATRAQARRCPKLAVIDDHGQGGWRGDVDLVIDPNVGARGMGPSPSLAGSRYALVRREVLALVGTEPQPRSVVVVGGGSPPDEVLAWMEGVARSLPRHLHVDVVQGGRNLAALMADAELVISAAGTAVLEACALGKPVVAFTWAENQRPGAVHLASAGLVTVGDVSYTDPGEVAAVVGTLVNDRGRLADLARTCSSLVDGRGARRVVSRLLGRLLNLRPATIDDAQVLWRWANDPAVRSSAFSSDSIGWEDHLRWMEGTMKSPGAEIAVVSWSATLIGQVRFDQEKRRAEVHFSLDKSWRGRGLGGPLLAAATDWYLQRHPEVEAVEGRVKVGNAASQASFLDADFDTDGLIEAHPAPHLRYRRARNGTGPGR